MVEIIVAVHLVVVIPVATNLVVVLENVLIIAQAQQFVLLTHPVTMDVVVKIMFLVVMTVIVVIQDSVVIIIMIVVVKVTVMVVVQLLQMDALVLPDCCVVMKDV